MEFRGKVGNRGSLLTIGVEVLEALRHIRRLQPQARQVVQGPHLGQGQVCRWAGEQVIR